MKKSILLALTALMMVGCTYTKEETIKNMSVDGYILKEIDSCEYFMVRISSYMDGGCYLPIHKNNCRFCKERRQKELEELVIRCKTPLKVTYKDVVATDTIVIFKYKEK